MRRYAPALVALVLATTGCGAKPSSTPVPAITGPDPLASATYQPDDTPPGAILTQRGDNSRIGWYATEKQLTVASVGGGHFGKRASFPVDGKVYAQPLYVPGLSVGGTSHNVLLVATEHDSVYAFDADATGSTVAPLWRTSLLQPGARPMLAARDRVANDQLCDSITPEVGVTSTPVVDWASKTLYAVALDVESGKLTYRIHALDIRTGKPTRTSTVISSTVDGTGVDQIDGKVAFTPTKEQQRLGLTLVNGIVYAGFASFCGWGVYHGWVFGYRTGDLAQAIVYNSSPDGYSAGFWESQNGITVDEHGHLILVSGNGPYDLNTGGREVGDSVLKMAPVNGTLRVVDSFTPFDQECRNRHDQDLGSGSPLLVPGHHEYVLSSKTGAVYVLDADHLGGYTSADDPCNHEGRTDVDKIKQELTVDSVKGGMWGTWAYWRSGDAEYVYGSGSTERMTQWRLDSEGRLVTAPVAQAPQPFDYPGAVPVVSSNGSVAGTGIVWTVDETGGPATLRAFDAADIGRQLWTSAGDPARDAIDNTKGNNHFQVPTIADGKVYVGGQGHVEVYGLLP